MMFPTGRSTQENPSAIPQGSPTSTPRRAPHLLAAALVLALAGCGSDPKPAAQPTYQLTVDANTGIPICGDERPVGYDGPCQYAPTETTP